MQSGLQEECWRSAERWCALISVTIRSGQQGQRALQECWRSAQRWLTSISSAMGSAMLGQRVLQECWRCAQRWLTSMSVAIRSAKLGQRALQECWGSAQRSLISISAAMGLDQSVQRGLQECCGSAQDWCTWISATMTSDRTGQRVLQECLGSAQRWLTSISKAMGSKLSGKGGSELRGAVKPLVLFYRHLALLARCHLFSRQATRNSDILYTYSAVAFGLALSLSRKELMNKWHDLYLISLLWVVVLLCIYAQYQSISRRGIYLQIHDPASKHCFISIHISAVTIECNKKEENEEK
jgi:hypothetical protein